PIAGQNRDLKGCHCRFKQRVRTFVSKYGLFHQNATAPLVSRQDQLDVCLQTAHIGPPLLIECSAVNVDRFVEQLIDDLGAQKRVGGQLAQATVKGEELVKMLFHQKVRQRPSLPVAVQRRAV